MFAQEVSLLGTAWEALVLRLFSQPSEEGFVLYFLQNLLHWFSEHGINRLHVALSSLSQKISPRLVMVISFRAVIIPFGGNELLLSFSL